MRGLITSFILTSLLGFCFLFSCANQEMEVQVPTSLLIVDNIDTQPWETPHIEVSVLDQNGQLMYPQMGTEYEYEQWHCSLDSLLYRKNTNQTSVRMQKKESRILVTYGGYELENTRNQYRFIKKGQVTGHNCGSNY